MTPSEQFYYVMYKHIYDFAFFHICYHVIGIKAVLTFRENNEIVIALLIHKISIVTYFFLIKLPRLVQTNYANIYFFSYLFDIDDSFYITIKKLL